MMKKLNNIALFGACFVSAGNESNGCAGIHRVNAAGGRYPVSCHAAGLIFRRLAAGFLVWLSAALGGCGVKDRAIAIPVGGMESAYGTGDEIQAAMPSTGQNVSAQFGGEMRESTQQVKSGGVGGSAANAQTDGGTGQMIYVHVCGAVNCPGVVELPDGSRAETALQAAGGFLDTAQKDYVNLAEKLFDGQKLYFPSEEEACLMIEKEAQSRSGLVNINRADEETLCSLPGIGGTKAQDIIAYREANGGFGQKEDLMKVSGIKENTYNRLSDKITVD